VEARVVHRGRVDCGVLVRQIRRQRRRRQRHT
jgi:hypothetical protein